MSDDPVGDLLVCFACETNPPRALPDPIPEGWPVMFSEMMAGRGLYCEACFESGIELMAEEET